MSIFPRLPDYTPVENITLSSLKSITEVSQLLTIERGNIDSVKKTFSGDWNIGLFRDIQKLSLRVWQVRTCGKLLENLGHSSANIRYKSLDTIRDAILYGAELLTGDGIPFETQRRIQEELLWEIKQAIEKLSSFIGWRIVQQHIGEVFSAEMTEAMVRIRSRVGKIGIWGEDGIDFDKKFQPFRAFAIRFKIKNLVPPSREAQEWLQSEEVAHLMNFLNRFSEYLALNDSDSKLS